MTCSTRPRDGRPDADEPTFASFPAALADEPSEHSFNRRSEEDDKGVHTPLADILAAKGWNLSRSMEYCEKLLLSFALRKSRGIQSQTSKLLGITPRTLYSKIRKYDLLRNDDK